MDLTLFPRTYRHVYVEITDTLSRVEPLSLYLTVDLYWAIQTLHCAIHYKCLLEIMETLNLIIWSCFEPRPVYLTVALLGDKNACLYTATDKFRDVGDLIRNTYLGFFVRPPAISYYSLSIIQQYYTRDRTD